MLNSCYTTKVLRHPLAEFQNIFAAKLLKMKNAALGIDWLVCSIYKQKLHLNTVQK